MRHLPILLSCALLAGASAAGANDDWRRGVEAYRGGDYATAETIFRATAEAQPDWPGGHLMLGRTLDKQGRLDEAADALRRATEAAPGDFKAALALAQVALRLERPAEAEGVLAGVEVAGLEGPQRDAYGRIRAQALLDLERDAEALPWLRAVAGETPADAELQLLLADTAADLGDTAAAFEAFARAARARPDDAAVHRRWATALWAAADAGEGAARAAGCATATARARRAAELEPSADHLQLLGDCALCAGDHQAAAAAFERALAGPGKGWRAQYGLAQAHFAGERWEAARQAFVQALDSAGLPADKAERAWARLGYLYERADAFEDAIAAYREAGDGKAEARVIANRDIQLQQDRDAARADLQAQQDAINAEIDALGGGGYR